jgi:hypothetical protein
VNPGLPLPTAHFTRSWIRSSRLIYYNTFNMTTASCSYTPAITYPTRPRYLERNSSSSSTISHKRAGILKTTSEYSMIAQQRSNALLQSVSEGDISLDAILAFPIDWQGIAGQLQWTRSRMATIREDDEDAEMTTMNPLDIKTRRRSADSNRQNRHAMWASASARSQSLPSYVHSSSYSSLGLNIDAYTSESSSSSDEMDVERPSTPDFYSSSMSSSSSLTNSPVSSPISSSSFFDDAQIEDESFELKTYCSVFNETTYSAVPMQKDETPSSPSLSNLVRLNPTPCNA